MGDLKVILFMYNKNSITWILIQYAFLFLLFTILISNFSCRNKSEKNIKKENGEVIVTDRYPDDIKTQAIRNADSSWGFTIYVNGKIYVHQKEIPLPESSSGFNSEGDALSVAGLIVNKLKKHISPETITRSELESLGIVTSKSNIK